MPLDADGRDPERVEALLDEAQRTYPDQAAGPDDRWWLPGGLWTGVTQIVSGFLALARLPMRRAVRAAGNTPPERL